MSINYNQLNQFVEKQKKYIVDFINDPNEFVKQVIIFATQGKNHTDLAEYLNLPESLVKSLILLIKKYKLEKKCKCFEAFLLNLTNTEQFYTSFIKTTKTEPKGLNINFWFNPANKNETFLEDVWFDFDESIDVFYPIKPEPNKNVSISIYGQNTWELNLRDNDYATANTTEEKKEILQLLELTLKYTY